VRDAVHLPHEQLRAATRYYEQHVIAWHALGRLREAHAVHDLIAHYRRLLRAGVSPTPSRTGDDMGQAHRAPETMLVTLRLDRATETISGTLADERGDERPFWGWLELSTALDETRDIDWGHGPSIRVRDKV
jgi:hypothetical protein